MKGLRGAIAGVMIVCVMQACSDHKPQNYNALPVDTDGDTTPDTTIKLNMVVDKEDSQFAIEAMNGGATEVALGNLAIKKGRSKEVKNFGAMMVKDHSKADSKLLILLKAKNIPVPATPDAQSQALITKLSQKSGADFDKAYVSWMLYDHKKTVREFTDGSVKLQDPDLKNFAKKTLPVLQNHLEEITAIHDNMK
jgi:putative membrane protein